MQTIDLRDQAKCRSRAHRSPETQIIFAGAGGADSVLSTRPREGLWGIRVDSDQLYIGRRCLRAPSRTSRRTST